MFVSYYVFIYIHSISVTSKKHTPMTATGHGLINVTLPCVKYREIRISRKCSIVIFLIIFLIYLLFTIDKLNYALSSFFNPVKHVITHTQQHTSINIVPVKISFLCHTFSFSIPLFLFHSYLFIIYFFYCC